MLTNWTGAPMPRRRPFEDSELASATEGLLAAAARLEAPSPAEPPEAPSLRGFSRIYSDWITFKRGLSGDPSDRLEKNCMLLHCMLSAPTLGDALQLALRFNRFVRDERGLVAIREAGPLVALQFDEPFRPEVHGLVSDLWPLALMLVEMEWLVGAALDGVVGRVRNPPSLSAETAALLFDRPIVYDAPDLELLVPRRHLSRAVVARPGGIIAFLKDLPFTTLKGAGGRRPDMRTLVSGLVRNDTLQQSGAATNLSEIAARLGQSPATLRRRLSAEGTGFREIRETVLDELAKAWLVDESLPVETIAERLGYSDAFAFRRSFRRRNGYSPTTFRREFGVSPRDPRGASPKV
jgi:AraC-like DNA-binding protein